MRGVKGYLSFARNNTGMPVLVKGSNVSKGKIDMTTPTDY